MFKKILEFLGYKAFPTIDVKDLISKPHFVPTSAVVSEDMKDFLQELGDAVLMIDNFENILFANKTVFGLAGPSGEAARLSEIFRDPTILGAFKKTIAMGVPVKVDLPLQFYGRQKFFLLNVVPLKKNSETVGAAGIFHDVTILKQADQMRIDFVANVSHELRTPLTSIKGYTQALDQEIKDPSAKKYLQVVAKNVDRLINLVNDLLDLSFLEAGATLELAKVDVEQMTKSVLQQVESQRTEKRQSITTKYSVDSFFADEERAEQVLLNLVQNAVKYIPDEGRIEIEWSGDSKTQDVLLTVRDSGPGIAPEHISRIFERFYRADKARSPAEQGGTGLGLSIAKHVMQRHGGSINVRSEPGQGTEFVCRFPKRN